MTKIEINFMRRRLLHFYRFLIDTVILQVFRIRSLLKVNNLTLSFIIRLYKSETEVIILNHCSTSPKNYIFTVCSPSRRSKSYCYLCRILYFFSLIFSDLTNSPLLTITHVKLLINYFVLYCY